MTKKLRNKKYIQKYSKSNLSPAFAFTHNEQSRLMLLSHLALTSLAEGKGTLRDTVDVMARLMTGRELAIIYFGDDVGRVMHDAVLRISALYLQWEKTKAWILTPDDRLALGEALSLADDMQSHLTRKEYYKVFDAVKKLRIEKLLDTVRPWEEYLEYRKKLLGQF